MYKRKTRDVWALYVNYGQGWEYEFAEDTHKEICKRRKEYRENLPQYPVKIVLKREKIN